MRNLLFNLKKIIFRFEVFLGEMKVDMKRFLTAFCMVVLLVACGDEGSSTESSQEKQENEPVAFEYGTLTDSRDGNQYRTIRIGSQNWMAENLRYAYFDNDDVSCKDGTKSSCDSLGRFYSWAEAMDTLSSGCGDDRLLFCTRGKYAVPKHFRGVCPEGWRIPTEEDWNVLLEYAGGADSAGIKLMTRKNWFGGLDSFGFDVLPTGLPTHEVYNKNYGSESQAYFWAVSESYTENDKGMLFLGKGVAIFGLDYSAYPRLSVRCVEGGLDMPNRSYKTEYDDSVLVDKRDGQTYRVVTIGNEVWMAENLNYEYNDGVQSICHKEDSLDCQTYGRLYTWAGAMALDEEKYGYRGSAGVLAYPHQGVCPDGWHIPSVDEFRKLFESVGGFTSDANGLYMSGEALKSTSGWYVNGENGTDLVGFSALPAGVTTFKFKDSDFSRVYGDKAGFWSDVETHIADDAYYAYYLQLSSYDSYDGRKKHRFEDSAKDLLMSVRCVKD